MPLEAGSDSFVTRTCRVDSVLTVESMFVCCFTSVIAQLFLQVCMFASSCYVCIHMHMYVYVCPIFASGRDR